MGIDSTVLAGSVPSTRRLRVAGHTDDSRQVFGSASGLLARKTYRAAIRQTRGVWRGIRTRRAAQRASTPGARPTTAAVSMVHPYVRTAPLPAVAALMWSKLSPSVKRLWLGAGGLFVAGNVFKYWTWVVAHDAVIKVEQEAHEDASRQLREARDSAQKYALPPLKK